MIPKGRSFPTGFFRSEKRLLGRNARGIVRAMAENGKPTSKAARGRALGARLRALRRQRGWTLAQVAKRSGLAISTVSKIERGLLAPAYYKLTELARALGVDAGDLLVPARRRGFANGAVVTRQGEGPHYKTQNYTYHILAAELPERRMLPTLGRLHARDIGAFDELSRHDGEEFLFILEGSVDVYVDGKPPVRLKKYDSIYHDSSVDHAYVSAGKHPARVILVWSGPERTRARRNGTIEDAVPDARPRRAAAGKSRARGR